MVSFITDWLLTSTHKDLAWTPRVPITKSRAGEVPRDIVMQFEHSRLNDTVFNALRNIRNIKYNDSTTEIFQDISPAPLSRSLRM